VLAVHVDSASQVLYYATTTVRAGSPQHALVRVSLTLIESSFPLFGIDIHTQTYCLVNFHKPYTHD
jgi:hypothetical protein